MNKAKVKDIVIRALKTFVQTFVSYLTIDGLFAISDKVGFQRWLLTTGVSALAAGISAVWNLLLDAFSRKAGEALDKIGKDDLTPVPGEDPESVEDIEPDPDDTDEAKPGDLI